MSGGAATSAAGEAPWFKVPLKGLDAATRDGRLKWVKWFDGRRKKRLGVQNRAGAVWRFRLNHGAHLQRVQGGLAVWDCEVSDLEILGILNVKKQA